MQWIYLYSNNKSVDCSSVPLTFIVRKTLTYHPTVVLLYLMAERQIKYEQILKLSA